MTLHDAIFRLSLTCVRAHHTYAHEGAHPGFGVMKRHGVMPWPLDCRRLPVWEFRP